MNELDVLKRFRDDVPEPSTDAWLRARAAIEAARAETSERPTQLGAGRRSTPRYRRRLVVVGFGVAVAVIAVGAALATDKQSPSAPVARSDSAGRNAVRPNASVVRTRLIDALSGEKDTIFYTQSSTEVPGQPTRTGEEWDYPWNGQPGQVVRQAGSGSVEGTVQNKWSLTFTVPAEGATNNGGETTGVACNVAGQRIDVDYANQTWQSSEQSCVTLTPGLDTDEFVDPTTHQPVSNIKALVADGLLRVVGYPTIEGQSTVELKSNTRGATTLELWVNASTYLPVRSMNTSPTGDPNPGKTSTTVDRYSFLSPTQANLASLQVTVPAGFREIASSQKG
ncbi:MAG TPA: hypothetical protein VGG09_15690 [Acidimicrobiales bacterium]|jgi:hypothetical protein